MSVDVVHRQAHERRYRSRSKGSAKADCYTCSASNEHCDRQRPKCATCIHQQRDCGGFPTALVWKDSPSQLESSSLPPGHSKSRRPFKFVQGRPKTKRKPKVRRSQPATFAVNAVDELSPTRGDFLTAFDYAVPGSPWDRSHSQHRHEAEDIDASISQANDFACVTDRTIQSIYLPEDLAELGDPPQSEGSLDLNPTVGGEDIEIEGVPSPSFQMELAQSIRPFTSSLSSVLFNDTAHRMDHVLTLYNEEFCVLPLSHDCGLNPFRTSRRLWSASPSLLHGVLATSLQHLAKQRNRADLAEQALQHRSVAVHAFSRELCESDGASLLDSLLVLVNFELSQSALGAWTVHFKGAQKLLDELNRSGLLRTSSRVRSQAAMLIWWDMTMSLLSRKEPSIPISYLKDLMEYQASDDWSLFALTGCPYDLMLAIARLAKLASIHDKAAAMEWTTFDTTPVEQLTEKAAKWANYEELNIEEAQSCEENLETRRDRFHCIEAWRFSILLYARRVFYPKQDSAGLRTITYLSRLVLDHVKCIPSTAFVQKQALLPVFLAAAELGEGDQRTFVRQYCTHWSETARYSQFDTALSRLENIWKDWTADTRDVYWWGCKVGGTNTNDSREVAVVEDELQLG